MQLQALCKRLKLATLPRTPAPKPTTSHWPNSSVWAQNNTNLLWTVKNPALASRGLWVLLLMVWNVATQVYSPASLCSGLAMVREIFVTSLEPVLTVWSFLLQDRALKGVLDASSLYYQYISYKWWSATSFESLHSTVSVKFTMSYHSGCLSTEINN